MADEVAFIGDLSIGLDEYTEEYKGKISCVCGKGLIYVKESKEFLRKGLKNPIYRRCHYKHYDNEACEYPKMNTKSILKKEIDNKISTPEEKRKIKLEEYIKLITKDHSSVEALKKEINIIKKEILKYDIKDIVLNDMMIKISNINLYSNGFLRFNDLERIELNKNEFYRVSELSYNNDKRYPKHYLKKEYLDYICEDENIDKYNKIIKNLAIILTYYSARCDGRNIKKIEQEIKDFNELIKNRLLDIRHKKIREEALNIKWIEDD